MLVLLCTWLVWLFISVAPACLKGYQGTSPENHTLGIQALPSQWPTTGFVPPMCDSYKPCPLPILSVFISLADVGLTQSLVIYIFFFILPKNTLFVSGRLRLYKSIRFLYALDVQCLLSSTVSNCVSPFNASELWRIQPRMKHPFRVWSSPNCLKLVFSWKAYSCCRGAVWNTSLIIPTKTLSI